MTISGERRAWIITLALGGEFDGLSPAELAALSAVDRGRPAAEFFAGASAEDLAVFAGACDYECGLEMLWQIVRHPRCDAGTALSVYWRGRPGYYLRYPDEGSVPVHERGVYDLLREVEGGVAAGLYGTADVPFDPARFERRDLRPSSAWVRKCGRDVPPVMYRAVGQ